MDSFDELLALLLQLLLQSLVHSVLHPEEQLSLQDGHPELVLLFSQLLLQEEQVELVLLPSQLLLQPLHPEGSGSFVQEFNMGVEASIAIPNMGSAFSDASLKNSLLLCKCFIIEQIVFF
ncbi:MAG: hypothetical protein IJQ83_07010 [Bacteroidales bacterium]|nr:hypothetical protein [Bacteroidales bacterium]